MRHASTALVLAVSVACSSSARAQSVAALGDVDGDGAIELVVGRRNPGTSGPSVGVFSSRDGQLRYWLRSDDVRSGFGTAVTRWRDLDGDGIDDFAVGAPGTDYPGGRWWPGQGRRDLCGFVYVFSGRTGERLRLLTGLAGRDGFGHALASADLDGDGRAELVVGSPGGRRVCVFDGASGECTWRFERPEVEAFGTCVDGASDLDGDGGLELLVGAPTRLGGSAFVLALRQGGLERIHLAPPHPRPPEDELDWRTSDEFTAPPGVEWLGTSLCGVGDLDGDRVPDYAVGARGIASLLSGSSGARFAELRASPEGLDHGVVLSLAALGDVDGDGVPDLVLGDEWDDDRAAEDIDEGEWPHPGSVSCFSGAKQKPLWKSRGPRSQAHFGAAIAAVPDVDGDGLQELVVEAREQSGETPSFHLLSGRTGAELVVLQFPGDAAWRAKRDLKR